MHNIFNTADKLTTIKRFNKLHSHSQRLCGTMHVEEMLWHLRSQLELALGIKVQTTNVKTNLSNPHLRWLIFYVIPWPKGSRTAPEMNVKKGNQQIKNIQAERNLLLYRLQQAEAASDLHAHPLFSKMSKKLWGRLIWKHFDHHLRQFDC